MFPFMRITQYDRHDEKLNENVSQSLGFHAKNGWFGCVSSNLVLTSAARQMMEEGSSCWTAHSEDHRPT